VPYSRTVSAASGRKASPGVAPAAIKARGYTAAHTTPAVEHAGGARTGCAGVVVLPPETLIWSFGRVPVPSYPFGA